MRLRETERSHVTQLALSDSAEEQSRDMVPETPSTADKHEKLLTEQQVIAQLGLGDRPNPGGALRWLVRMKRIGCVRIGRGIMRFRPQDVDQFISGRYEAAKRA